MKKSKPLEPPPPFDDWGVMLSGGLLGGVLQATGAIRLRQGLFGAKLEEQFEDIQGNRCWKLAKSPHLLSKGRQSR